MKLHKLYIDSFRNFRNFSIDFESDLNIIVGPNGVGKSTILKIIDDFFRRSYGWSFNDNEIKNSFICFQFFPITLSKQKIEKMGYSSCYKYKQPVNLDFFADFQAREHFRTLPSYKFDEELVDFNIYDLVGKKVIFISLFNSVNNINNQAGFIIHSNSLYLYEGAERNNLVKAYFDSVKAKALNFNESAYLREYVSSLEEKNGGRERLKKLQESEAYRVNKVASLENSQIKYRQFFSMDPQLVSKDGIEIDKLSSGEQQISKLEVYIKSVNEIKNKISIIDEPEIHLNYGQTAYLSEVINRIKGISQVFIATHSEDLIRSQSISNLKYIKFINSNTPKYVNSHSLNKVKSHWLRQNPKVLFSKAAVFVEGFADSLFFDRVLSLIFKEKKYTDFHTENIAIIPVFGKQNIKEYVNATTKHLGIRAFVITDTDFINAVSPYPFTDETKKALMILNTNHISEHNLTKKIKFSADYINRLRVFLDHVFFKRTISMGDQFKYRSAFRDLLIQKKYSKSIVNKAQFKRLHKLCVFEGVWILKKYKLENYISNDFIVNGKVSIDSIQSNFYPTSVAELKKLLKQGALSELEEIAFRINNDLVKTLKLN